MPHHERVTPPTQDYPPDQWCLIEKHYRPEFAAQMETDDVVRFGVLPSRAR